MPVISRFFGIIVYMYWYDHTPPHFHARYQDDEVTVDIETGYVKGGMSPRCLRMLEEWRGLYHDKLLENWQLAQTGKELEDINPLE